MEILIAVLVIAALCVGGYFYFKHKQKVDREEAAQEAARARAEYEARQARAAAQAEQERVETKVERSDLISGADIDLLKKTRSRYFDDAIKLRRSQVEQARQQGRSVD